MLGHLWQRFYNSHCRVCAGQPKIGYEPFYSLARDPAPQNFSLLVCLTCYLNQCHSTRLIQAFRGKKWEREVSSSQTGYKVEEIKKFLWVRQKTSKAFPPLAGIACHLLMGDILEWGEWTIQRCWNHGNVSSWGIHTRLSGLIIACLSHQSLPESCDSRISGGRVRHGHWNTKDPKVVTRHTSYCRGDRDRRTAGWGCLECTRHCNSGRVPK